MIVTILWVLTIVSQSLIWIYGDLILARTKLKNSRRFIAEIDHFAEIEISQHGISVMTIVKYLDNGKEKKAVFYKDKRDKPGKRIEIVANDRIAVRNGVFFPEELKVVGSIFSIIVMIWGGPFLYKIFDMVVVFGLGIAVLVIMSMLISKLLFCEVFYAELKKAVHL